MFDGSDQIFKLWRTRDVHRSISFDWQRDENSHTMNFSLFCRIINCRLGSNKSRYEVCESISNVNVSQYEETKP